MSQDAEGIVKAAIGSLGAKAGEPVKSDAVTFALRKMTNPTGALELAKARGWLKPLGSQYWELTRRGYVATQLESEKQSPLSP